MRAIFSREFFSYFRTYTGWLFTAVLWLFVSIYVVLNNFFGLSGSIVNSLSIAIVVLPVLVPVLTMRTVAGERRSRTDRLLLSAPVGTGQVILGKFCAAAAVFSLPLAGICLYPLLFSRFGEAALPESYLGIFGLWLFGLAAIAVGIFVSSLAENPLTAAVLSFAVLFVSFTMTAVRAMAGGIPGAIAYALDLPSRFDDFLGGTLNLGSAAYLVTVTALFLFLADRSVERRRFPFSGKMRKRTAIRAVSVLIAVAAAAGGNAAIAHLPESRRVIDLTANRIYGLSDETKKLVRGLGEDITIYILAPEESQDNSVASTLRRYAELSPHVHLENVDMAKNPGFADKYADGKEVYTNSLVVESPERYRLIPYMDLYGTEGSVDSGDFQMTSYDAEGQITSALSYVTTDSMPKAYVLTGHGEMALDGTFSNALAKLNVEAAELDLLQNDKVPDDAAAVIVNGPTSDLSADDLAKLEDYAGRGGNFFLVTNFTAQSDMPEYASLLSWYGVAAKPGVVIEQDAAHYYQNGTYLLPDLRQDAQITHDAAVGNGYVFTPYAQALTHPADGDGLTYTDLLTTTADSYNHTDITSQSMAKADGDEDGPFTVGLSVRKDISGGAGSEAVIISSPNILTANADQVVSGSNRKLFAGAMTELTGTETSISIPAKSFSGSGLTMSARTALILGLIAVVLIPGFLLLFGGAYVLLRRRR